MSAHGQRKHSKFSASASERWLNCPASVVLSEKAPPQKSSPYAIEGTKAHECLEFLVRNFSKREKAVGFAKQKWPEDMVEHCFRSAVEVYALRPSAKARLFVESRVSLSSISDKIFGTLDYAWCEPGGDLVVIDFKYGQGLSVSPHCQENGENPQLMFYASGICHKVGYNFKSVKLSIIQPRIWSSDERASSSYETAISQIKAFEKRIVAAIKDASRSSPTMRSGEHCRYCPAAAICPEASKKVMEKADIVFDIEAGEIKASPETKLIDLKRLPEILKACDQLELWIDAVRKLALERAESGVEIPGYKLVAKRSTRSWLPGADEKALEVFGGKAFGEPEFLSPAQLEKKLGASAKEFTQKYTTNISSGFTLVSEKDKRPAIKNALVFDVDTPD